MYTNQSQPTVPTAPVLKSRPTLNPLFTSRSSQGTAFESDSSRQPSSIGHVPSSTGTDTESRPGWLVPQESTSASCSDYTKFDNATSILQRRTTKELVKIFEKHTPHASTPASQPLLRGGIKNTLNEPLPSLPKSTPLRESFRNLFSAFSKAKKTFGEQHPNVAFKRGQMSIDRHTRFEDATCSSSKGVTGDLSIPSRAKPTISRLVPGLSHDIQNGILLYFDNDPSGPLWHRCEAFLAPPNLRLSYFTPSGKSITKTISINGAIDARSIASTNCAAVVPPMLDASSPHVFELEFSEGITEKFAATSVLERGGWISAIWDVIVSSKSSSVMEKPRVSAALDLPLSLPTNSLEDEQDKCDDADQGLPSFEEGNSLANDVAPHGPLPTMWTDTDESPSNWSTTGSSLVGSRSVRTLAGLSLVKQRLAQLDTIADTSNSSVTLAYATPPRTPPPLQRRQIASSNLSRGTTSSYSQSSPSRSTLQSPIPIRAPSLVSSCIARSTQSSHRDEESSYLLETDETPSTPEVELDMILRNVPKQSTSSHEKAEGESKDSLHAEPGSYIDPQSFQEAMVILHENAKDHQAGLKKLVKEISLVHNDVKLAIQQPPLPVPQLNDLKERLEALATGLDSVDLQGLHTKIDAIQEHTQKPPDMTLKNEAPNGNDHVAERLKGIEETMKAIGSLGEQSGSDMSAVFQKLNAIQEQYEAREVPPPVPEKDGASSQQSAMEGSLQEFQQKLGNLEKLLAELKQFNEKRVSELDTPLPQMDVSRSLSVFRGRNRETTETKTEPPNSETQPEVLEILQLVKEDKEQRNSLADQFGDTVRYLNELNAWMEAFVTKTGGNDLVLQKISETMDRISQDPNAGAFNLRNMGASSGNPEASASLADVEDLVTQTRAQESVLHELKVSIQAVLAAIQDNARQQAELRETQGIDAILAVLDRNRQEQDALLRAIAENLSADIRGERIRFVDAMKDATSVNVTAHLEEFKRELSKEVMIMLQDVGKLARARERKHLEQEIAEIFNQQIVEQTSSRFGPPSTSTGFQPLQHSRPPSRPHSQGPYPVFMMPPVAEAGMPATAMAHPMPLHPSVPVGSRRPLPVPSPSSHSNPSPGPHPVSMSIIPTMSHIPGGNSPVRRRA